MRPATLRKRIDAAAWTIACLGAALTLATGPTWYLIAGALTAIAMYLTPVRPA